MITGFPSSVYKNACNDPWKDVVADVLKKYLGEERRAGKGTFSDPNESYESILTRSPFSRFEVQTELETITRDIDSILGWLSSTSFATRSLFGDRIEVFEKELTERLLELNSEGTFTETAPCEMFFVWK